MFIIDLTGIIAICGIVYCWVWALTPEKDERN